MNSTLLLTRLQVKESLGAITAKVEKRTGSEGALAGTILIGLMIVGAAGWLGYAAYGATGGPMSSRVMYDMILLAVGAATFLFSLPTVLSSFFGESDIYDLLPLPVSPFSIVFSKALSALVASYMWTALFAMGPLAGWGIAAGAGPSYWVTYVAVVLLAPLMPVAYSGTISIVVASAFKRLRRKDTITTITTVLVLAGSVAGFAVSRVISNSGGLAEAFGSMAETMGTVVMAFPAYGFAVYGLQYPDPLSVVMFVVISVGSFLVFVLVARMLYLRVITSLTAGGARAKAYEGEVRASSTSFGALVGVEVKKIVRNSPVLLNYVAYPVLVAPAIMVFGVFNSSLGSGMLANRDAMGIIGVIIYMLLMFFLVVSCCANRTSVTAISRDGSNWSNAKYLPVPLETQILAKTVPAAAINALITLVIMGVAGGYVAVMGGIDAIVPIASVVIGFAVSWLMACLGIWYDARSPRVDWGDDASVNTKALRGGGGDLRCLGVGLLLMMTMALGLPFLGLGTTLGLVVAAVVDVLIAVVLGRRLIASAARRLSVFE